MLFFYRHARGLQEPVYILSFSGIGFKESFVTCSSGYQTRSHFVLHPIADDDLGFYEMIKQDKISKASTMLSRKGT